MILNCSQLWISLMASLALKNLTLTYPTGFLSTSCLLLIIKVSFLIFGLKQQFSKLNNPTIYLPNNIILSPVDSARNHGVIFDINLSFAEHFSTVSKSCLHNIRGLRRIRNTIDQTSIFRGILLRLIVWIVWPTAESLGSCRPCWYW